MDDEKVEMWVGVLIGVVGVIIALGIAQAIQYIAFKDVHDTTYIRNH